MPGPARLRAVLPSQRKSRSASGVSVRRSARVRDGCRRWRGLSSSTSGAQATRRAAQSRLPTGILRFPSAIAAVRWHPKIVTPPFGTNHVRAIVTARAPKRTSLCRCQPVARPQLVDAAAAASGRGLGRCRLIHGPNRSNRGSPGNKNRLSGDPARFIRGQKRHGRCDVFRLPGAA